MASDGPPTAMRRLARMLDVSELEWCLTTASGLRRVLAAIDVGEVTRERSIECEEGQDREDWLGHDLAQGVGVFESIEQLGFLEDDARYYRRLLDNPGGLVLVVGPTGSGKTTTLYAGLRALAANTERKVISIEDPVEMVCPGAQQVQVSEEAGFGFADVMRAFVREDPDAILLGEVRDTASALEAIRASQTGHLVLSSLHSNDAIDSVQRLRDLGMHSKSIATELAVIFAQRLARRICDNCREETTPDASLCREIFGGDAPDGFRAYHGRGCERCRDTGSYGRIAVIERLSVTPDVRRAIARGDLVDDLRVLAMETGLVPQRDRALALASAGIIAFDNLPKFIPLERLAPTNQR